MITTEDLALINRYSAKVKADASAIGLTLHYSSDPHSFVEFLGTQESTHGVSSAHSPEFTDILRREFAWLRADDETGRGVCSHAIRVVETASFIEDILTQRLYGDIEVLDHWEDVELYPEARELKLSGRIAIGGGLWIAPSHRGANLSALLRKVLRVVSLPRLGWTSYVSIFRNTPNRRQWAMSDSWNTRLISLSHGYYRPYGTKLDVCMTCVTAEETLEFLRAEAHRGQD